jgi:hypothetical protein
MAFLVWRQGIRGPVASVDAMDPRQSADWKIIQQTMIQIIPLAEHELGMSLSTLIVLHPCPEIAE